VKTGNTRRAEDYANLSKFIPLRPAKEGAGRGQTEGNTEGQTGVPNGGHTLAGRGQTGWWTEGLFTFKRKTDMFCIRVM
jgi:hypothetical protein